MPVHFGSLVNEHVAVRSKVGIFDVSHMGEALAEGPGAFDFIQRLITNDAGRLEDGQALYTPMCQPDGGIIDDMLVYRMGPERWFTCFNGATVDKDLAWMREVAGDFDCRFEDQCDAWAQLAIQGPGSEALLDALVDRDLSELGYYWFWADQRVAGVDGCIVARTGYTGEDGFEVFCPVAGAETLWRAIFERPDAQPCGLGCRDTLRLEAKFLLYGNDMTERTNPLEAGLGWTVKFDKGDFVGRDALLARREAGLERRLVGFEVLDRGVARPGYAVLGADGQAVGQVTSGTHSPTLGKAIGLAYVPNTMRKRGTPIGIQIRNRAAAAQVVKTPFYTRSNS
jgi:aminomethyltransferase